ncbi:MAG: FAD-binding oxidoreductase [Gemmatimonadota bacterium]
MSEAVFSRLRHLLGERGIERDATGLPRAVPETSEAVAAVCRLAMEEGWRIRIEGRSTWLPPDAPAQVVLSLKGMDQIPSISPADLVATVEAGVTLENLRRHLDDHGMWLAVDPPGRSDRTIGSIVATGTSGPLRLGMGPVRDHILGGTFVTGDGRIITGGSRVVKNVAGYDITKLQVGGFGGFGIMTQFNIRLRSKARADITLTTGGNRDDLLVAARAILQASLSPAALELLSPAMAAGAQWVLAIRLLGPVEAVQSDIERLAADSGLAWETLPAERSGAFWTLTARAALSGLVTLRLGALPVGLDETLDLVVTELDEGLISAGAGDGTIRWTGNATPDQIHHLRRISAAREIPLTLERAPWNIRQATGHFGAYREGVGQLVERLRLTYDPSQIFSVALEGSQHE